MVQNDFIKKSIGTLTLGEKLKKIRSDKRINLGDVSKSTKIQTKYLEALEDGRYEDLPADVYVKGFLRSYAYYLGMSDEHFLKLYDREKKIQKNIKKEGKEKKNINPINFSSFIITPKIVVIGIICLLVFFGFFYLYREANIFISTPRLVVNQPVDGTETQDKSVNVEGVTEKDAEVKINDQPVLVNDEGKFNETIGLQEGPNTIIVKAKNRFNKEETKIISIKANYQAQTADNINANPSDSQNNQPNSGVKVELYVAPNPTWISVETDGNLVFSGVLASQAPQTFEAKEKISITSGKGNSTFVKVNGKAEKPLSSDPGVAKNIEFTNNN